MKTPDQENQEVQSEYEAPKLETVSLRGDEVLAGSCKDISGAGPSLTCRDSFGGSCASLGS
jgi:hypothetical protein